MPALDAQQMMECLRAFVAAQTELPEAAVQISELRRMAGGSSRETWSLDVEFDRAGRDVGPGRLELVMRRDPPGRVGDGDRGLEFRVVRAAHSCGVPAPRVHWCCTDLEVIGTPFYLMDRLPGEALPRRLLREDRYAKTRDRMTGQLAEIAVQIHRVPLDHEDLAGLPRVASGASAAEFELDRVAAAVPELAAEPHPALVLAERWLRARLPRTQRETLVHGDFRVGNVLFDEDGVTSVLDWELCKIGDPVEDLGWLCTDAWRFGSDKPVGGIGSREELLAAYAAAGGDEVDPAHLLFWEALGSFKVALVFIQQSWVYRSGAVPSLELASLGRRTAEAEQELVRLMEESP
jgi:aminoglycoside phosphotransferase (APT) family kinase protein